MYVDTHCHISKKYYDNIDLLISEIRKSGVKCVIVNGTDYESNLEVLELVNKYDIVYGAIGFHPTELDNFSFNYLEWLDKHLSDNKIVAVGEIGLDYHYENTNKVLQQDVFRKQLLLATKHDKPVIIHSRDAIQDTYDIINEFKLKGSIHCFSGSLEMAKRFISIGYMIGIGGVCTFKNSKVIKDVIKGISLEYILLETDSPYLAPVPYRGEINSSKYIPIIAQEISNIKNIKTTDIGTMTSHNAIKLFNLPDLF